MQGIPGEKGEKGDSGLMIIPSYANFLNTSSQTIQFETMQRGFVSFNSTQVAKDIELTSNTDIVVLKAGVYKIDLSFPLTIFTIQVI